MPSIVTHYLFSEDVLTKAPQELQNKILKSHKLYNIFAQSFDNLFYYNLLNFKREKIFEILETMLKDLKLMNILKI